MRDLATMLWKEGTEFAGNRRFLRIFVIAVLITGILPTLERAKAAHATSSVWMGLFSLAYAVFAAAVLVAQSAPDLVLRERSGRTLEYLLGTRLPDGAIFGGKVLMAAAVGYGTTLVVVGIQLLAANLLGHHGPWTWSYLALPQGRLLAFLLTPGIALYLATIGTFVALRVGDQRSAYLMTMLSLGLLAVPFLLHLVHPHLAMPWLWRAVETMGAIAIVVLVLGARLFRRQLLVLSLQE